jgi:hypothetical protein
VLSNAIDVVYGFLICWLLNLVHVAIAFLLLASSDRMLASVYVLTAGLGLLQIGYVVPIYRLLWRKGKPWVARGLLMAAAVTAVVNFIIDYHFFGPRMFQFLR